MSEGYVQRLTSEPRATEFPTLDPKGPTHVRVLLRHPAFPKMGKFPGCDVRTVGVGHVNDYGDLDYVVDQFGAAMRKAISRAAADHLHHSRSARMANAVRILNRLDDPIEVVEVGFVGRPARYMATTLDLDGKSPHSLEVLAVTEAEAEFQAKWARCRLDNVPSTDVAHCLERLDFVLVEDLTHQPLDPRLDRDVLVALARECLAFGHDGPALEAAVEWLRRAGFDLDAQAAPKPR